MKEGQIGLLGSVGWSIILYVSLVLLEHFLNMIYNIFRLIRDLSLTLAPQVILLAPKMLLDYLRPMTTIQPIPSVHPQSLFNHLTGLGLIWVNLQWPPMTSNDLQWPPPHSNFFLTTFRLHSDHILTTFWLFLIISDWLTDWGGGGGMVVINDHHEILIDFSRWSLI